MNSEHVGIRSILRIESFDFVYLSNFWEFHQLFQCEFGTYSCSDPGISFATYLDRLWNKELFLRFYSSTQKQLLFRSYSTLYYSATQQSLLFHSFLVGDIWNFHSDVSWRYLLFLSRPIPQLVLFLNSATAIPQWWNILILLLFLVRNKLIPQFSNTPSNFRIHDN